MNGNLPLRKNFRNQSADVDHERDDSHEENSFVQDRIVEPSDDERKLNKRPSFDDQIEYEHERYHCSIFPERNNEKTRRKNLNKFDSFYTAVPFLKTFFHRYWIDGPSINKCFNLQERKKKTSILKKSHLVMDR